MPNYLHRPTKTQLFSVAEADLPNPVSEYILDPVLPDAPAKYWIISGNDVTLMSKAARDVVDAAELEAQKDSIIAELSQNMGLVRAVLLLFLDEFNDLRAEHGLPARTPQQLITAARNKLGN